MTDWKIQGSLPPRSREEWDAEFRRYQGSPEFQQRRTMSLGEFKVIYWWEYGHRMLGRSVGLAFGLPFLYFGVRGHLGGLTPRLWGLFGLGGVQGLVGWWMVKSGLDVNTSSAFGDPRKEIRVSPYRLATHLGLALTTYTGLVWTAMDVLSSSSPLATSQSLMLRRLSLAAPVVVFATALSGAFVAGNDAGRAYNTFPAMTSDGKWMPPKEDMLVLTPVYRNFFENTATVQFDHRCLALASTSIVGLQLVAAGPVWQSLPVHARRCLSATGIALGAQVGLGIATLLLYVPIPLAAAHQLGSLVLLTTSLATAHTLRRTTALVAARL